RDRPGDAISRRRRTGRRLAEHASCIQAFETTIGCFCTTRSKLRQTKAAASYGTSGAHLREIEKRRSGQYQLKDILAAASLCPRRDATMLKGRGQTTGNHTRA